MASMTNWLRTYTMKAGVSGAEGFEIGNTDSAEQTVLHISFSVEKSDSSTANTAKVQVWNLSDANLKMLDEADTIVELRAGYGNSNALIFTGTVSSVTTELDNADRMTEIEVIDGLVEIRDLVVLLSINGEVNAQTVYDTIARQAGMAIIYAPDLVFPVLPNGFSFVGTAKEALAKAAACCSHDYSIQNGIIQVTNPGMPIDVQGYLLSAETGLIKIPKRITINASDTSSEALSGYEIEYLLNGNIGINDIVYIESGTVSGYFRVYKLTIDGDNFDGDWVCTAQVLEIRGDTSAYSAA